jgi:hypothetical protein
MILTSNQNRAKYQLWIPGVQQQPALILTHKRRSMRGTKDVDGRGGPAG